MLTERILGKLRQSALVDVADGGTVLRFTYCYLAAHSLPPSDAEVHKVTAAIARYKGPQTGFMGDASSHSWQGCWPFQRA